MTVDRTHGLASTYRYGCRCGDCRSANRLRVTARAHISSAASRATDLRSRDPVGSQDARTSIADWWIAWSLAYYGHADRWLPYNPLHGAAHGGESHE